MARIAEFIAKEPVTELRVIAVSIKQGIRHMRPPHLAAGDWGGEPAVVGLAGELEDPARHRDGDPVISEQSLSELGEGGHDVELELRERVRGAGVEGEPIGKAVPGVYSAQSLSA